MVNMPHGGSGGPSHIGTVAIPSALFSGNQPMLMEALPLKGPGLPHDAAATVELLPEGLAERQQQLKVGACNILHMHMSADCGCSQL